MPGHRYWSLNASAVGGGSKAAWSVVKMLPNAGGKNAIAGCGANNWLAGKQAWKAFYGGASWNANTLPGWIGWYFGVNGPQTVATFSIKADGTVPGFSPGTFTLEYSDDGSSWTTAASFSGITFTANQVKTFATGAGSAHLYWRINVSATSSGTTVLIQTIDLLDGGSASLIKGTPSATSTNAGSVGGAAEAAGFVDLSSAASGWCSLGNVPQRWINDFGSGNAPQIVALTLTSPNNVLLANYNCTPTAFTLESSDDGSTWNVEASFTATWSSQDQTQNFGPVALGSMMNQIV